MSDYWKSLPRKFCDICKCWFADNKASIEFHEKGKNHQENVKKRINEIQKKGLKDYKAKKKLDEQMEKMEKAALEAFKKDLESNPELAARYNLKATETEKNTSKSVSTKTDVSSGRSNKKDPVKITSNSVENAESTQIWYEAITSEGYTYYWNNVTSESQWEPPEDGFVSLQEQEETSHTTESSETEVKTENQTETESVEESSVGATIGPQPKVDPYGSWVTVEQKAEEFVDLQLPAKSDTVVEVHIPLSKDDTFKIKEKTVGHLNETFGSGEGTFKKRKNLGSVKRNVRQRIAED